MVNSEEKVTLEERIASTRNADSLVVGYQGWYDLMFAHWRVSAEQVQARLPEGLWVDTYDGAAWIGVVPFFMRRVRPRWLPAVPVLSNFLELNLRTYVYDSAGRPGVWFFSLDCNQPLAVEVARRYFHLPYEHALMSARLQNEYVAFNSEREGGVAGVQRFVYRRAAAEKLVTAKPGTLEYFLVERYRLFAQRGDGSLWAGRVSHKPYTFCDGVVEQVDKGLFELNGFAEPEGEPESLLVSPGVDVRIHWLEKLD